MSDTGARFVGSALGAAIAGIVTLPTDVVKVRLQVQSGSAQYNGLADCLLQTARTEGVQALWKGLTPALVRQVCYTSMSLVIYEPIRGFYGKLLQDKDKSPSYLQRLCAGGTAGALAISVFNPAEVVKTQVQTTVGASVTMREVSARVWAQDGVRGFWAGLWPNVTRTFLVNAAELGTYDEAKSRLVPVLGDGFFAHVAASGAAGFTSACVSAPADVVKTRLMNSAGEDVKQYRGMAHAFSKILTEEGVPALYKGFLPICVRKLVWCAAFFVSYEKIRAGVNSSYSR